MKTVSLSKAKTKFSELCQEVATTCESLWTKRERHLREHGTLAPKEADFELPAPMPASWRDPLAAS